MPKIVWDLIFTLLIPITLLASNIPILNLSFAGLLEQNLGFAERDATRAAFVLAGLIPAAYILIDTYRTRKFNPVTALAAGSALTGGALAFLQIDGWRFALKDSYASIVVALVMGISLLLGRPFFGFVLKVALLPDSPQKEAAAERLVNAPTVKKALLVGTAVILVEALLNGTLNFFVNLGNVTASFGTKTFNDQVAAVNAIMRLPSIVMTFLAYGFAYYYAQWATERDFGDKAKLFEDSLWSALGSAPLSPAPLERVLASSVLERADQGATVLDGKRALPESVTHAALAEALKLPLEGVTSQLARWAEAGLIDQGYRRIVLVDEAGLRQRAGLDPNPQSGAAVIAQKVV